MRSKFSVVLGAVLLMAGTAWAADASMFRGDLGHSGSYGGGGIAHLDGTKWTYHGGGQFIASPAVSGNAVYEGGTDGFLYALDRRTGALKWKFATGDRIVSSPAVAAGTVYFLSYDGNLYAVAAANGALKWKFATGGERRFAAKHLHGSKPVAETMPDPWDCYLSSPAVWKGTVYFGSSDTYVYAVAAESGALRWKFKTGDVVHASPAVSGGTLYIGSWDTYFYALDAVTGAEKWRFKTGDDENIHNQTGIQSSAAVADGTVYFGSRDSHVYALDAATGAKRWAFATANSWVNNTPAVRGGKVYAATSDTGLIYELDARTGKPDFSVSVRKWPVFASLALSGDMLYAGLFSGEVEALDLKTHKSLWRFTTEASRKNAPALTAADGNGNFGAAFSSDFYDDSVAGYVRLLTLGSILASPVVADGTLYIASTDGTLYALALKP
jgi:outer membrane protein assembly factor BamB